MSHVTPRYTTRSMANPSKTCPNPLVQVEHTLFFCTSTASRTTSVNALQYPRPGSFLLLGWLLGALGLGLDFLFPPLALPELLLAAVGTA